MSSWSGPSADNSYVAPDLLVQRVTVAVAEGDQHDRGRGKGDRREEEDLAVPRIEQPDSERVEQIAAERQHGEDQQDRLSRIDDAAEQTEADEQAERDLGAAIGE